MSTVPPLLIDFQNVTVTRGDKRVLRGFTLQVKRHEHVALLGPNGSGKSTLVKLMTCELYPHAGTKGTRCRLFGRDEWALEDVRRRIGIVNLDLLQNLSHEVMARQVTAREMVLSGFFDSLGLWPHHRPTAAQERRALALLRFLKISHLAARPLSAMSSGEQRRAIIGRALVHDPAVLILDEPTNSLDPGAVREFRTVLRRLARSGRTLILVTHHISDLIPEIGRVVLMKGGRIVADGAKFRLLTSAKLSALFGAKLRVVKRGPNYDVVSD
ncbi:MAG: glnQ [Lacunisphaera sp.]|nr:glnQ [Lacunisphaera sp.]MDB6164982.1 glnQ [Lacunisphaera sp.]